MIVPLPSILGCVIGVLYSCSPIVKPQYCVGIYVLCLFYIIERKLKKQLQNGSAHAVGASYSGLYKEGEVEHINVFSLASYM